MSQESVRMLLVVVGSVLTLAALVSTVLRRDPSEGPSGWPREQRVPKLNRGAIGLLVVAGLCLAVAVALLVV